MGTNAYETLQALSKSLASVPFDVSELGNSTLLVEYKLKLRTICDGAVAAVEVRDVASPAPANSSYANSHELIGVPLLEFFSDCALATAVASTLQRALSEKLQVRNRAHNLSQEHTHLLVDLWGQIEAFKALFDFAARQVIHVGAGSGERKVKGVSLRAQCRVLSTGLEQVLLTLAVKLGEHYNLVSVAEIVDWTISQLRAPKYASLQEAINDELYGLVA